MSSWALFSRTVTLWLMFMAALSSLVLIKVLRYKRKDKNVNPATNKHDTHGVTQNEEWDLIKEL